MKKKIGIFLAICFGISSLSAGLFHFLGGNYKSLVGTLFATCYMLIPLISVVLTQLIVGEKPFSGCGISVKLNWWWLAGLLSMPVFALLTLPVSSILPGVSISTDNGMLQQSIAQMNAQGLPIGPWGMMLISIASGLIAACTINAFFAFGEEVAWRGFLSECFGSICGEGAKGFWKKALAIGAIWGVWHAPIILMGHNYPSHPVAGVAMMISFCMLFAPLIQFVRDKAKSVLAAAVMHGSLNAVAGLGILYLSGYNDLLCGCCGLAGMAILLVADIAVAICYKTE